MTMFGVVCFLSLLLVSVVGDYTVTIYPQYLYQGGKVTFDPDSWNSKMGLDSAGKIPYVNKTGARTGRWLHPEKKLFSKVPEDPHRKGHADVSFFHNKQFQHNLVQKYLSNYHGYGNKPIMLELKGEDWPKWMDCSNFKGHFPNDVNVAVETFLMLIQAIHDGVGGAMPPYFEPINEPGSFLKLGVNWTTIVEIFKLVGEKVKTMSPKTKVGGPAYDGSITTLDKWDFGKWSRFEEFLDMSLKSLDFFSFHPFNHFHVKGNTYYFSGPNEARLVGLVDMVETYAHLKTGKVVPIIFSAHGLSTITGVDANKPNPLLDWAYINLHNANIFTFLDLRGVAERAVAFLETFSDLKGQESINYSILDDKHHERDIALGFHLWENLTSHMMFLRSDSEFHQGKRQIQSHVLMDHDSRTLHVLLHNYDTNQAKVRLSFPSGWTALTHVKSTCLYRNSQQMTQLDRDVPVHVISGHVTVPPEATCFFKIPTGYNFAKATNVTERLHYGNSMIVELDQNSARMNITLHTNDIQNVEYARLRVTVSFKDHSAHTVPKTMTFNGHRLTSYYILHNPGTTEYQRLWGTIVYSVPANVLKLHNNDVQMTFAQGDGRVAAIALMTGNRLN